MMGASHEEAPSVSVVCPFFNEAAILEASVRRMIANLADLGETWELIIVNDGSKDDSGELAAKLAGEHPQLHVCGYPSNRGRGYAIRHGVENARGDLVVVTEIDSSWGDDIVQHILGAFTEHPDADIVIASPHLPEGGYRNVPFKRVFLSRAGNWLIRKMLTPHITMYTGMTRGYRRERFLALPLDETGKEMHLEIVNKAIALDYDIVEVPALLEWKDYKLTRDPSIKRKSSSNLPRLIRTHLLFSVAVAPFKYIFPISLVLSALSLGMMGMAIFYLFTPLPSIYLALTSLFLALFALVIFGVGLLAQKNNAVLREIWHLRSEQRTHRLNERWPQNQPVKSPSAGTTTRP